MKLTGPTTGPIAGSGTQRLLVPAYFSARGSSWREMADAIYSSLTTAILVMNPRTGPGTDQDPVTNADKDAYRKAMEHCQARRQTVIGYVNTRKIDGSLIPSDTVRSEIDKYYKDYKAGWVRSLIPWPDWWILWPDWWIGWFSRGIDGIFFDQMSNDAATHDYYKSLYNYIKGKSSKALVVGNPGIPAANAWQLTPSAVADILVVFEGPYVKADPSDAVTAYKDWIPPEWVASQPAPRLAHLVYESPDADTTRSICIASQQKGAGYIYVTQDVRPNPWDRPPDAAMIGSPTLYRR
jgi:Spherulation-specific family 4